MHSQGAVLEEGVEINNTQPTTWIGKWKHGVGSLISRVDNFLARSPVGRLFRLNGCGHPKEIKDARLSAEIRAGLTTFSTVAYIMAVNATILAEAGYDCPCLEPHNLKGDCANMDEWTKCHDELKLDLITATAAIAGLSSILFGLCTNLPVIVGPGMGLNAYFTYQVVGVKGRGPISYRLALTAIFMEGWIFMFLALTGMRHWLVKIIPRTIKIASGVGIGLFLTLIGMTYTAGIGIITGSLTSPLTLGGCPMEDLNEEGECASGLMTNPKMWAGIVFGGLLTTVLMSFRVKGAIIIGIAIVSILSWPRDTPFTYFPNTPDGDERYKYFSKVANFHPIKHTLLQQQWNLGGDSAAKFALALFTFLYVDIIDCTATLYSMARFCSRARKNESDFPRSTVAFCVDALCISIGSLLGVSPVTAFIESSAGIAEGGRTGLTAVVAGLCFLISLLFAPVLASVPPWATGSTLILVGCMMIRQVTKINWSYIGDAVPSFVTMVFIPFSYSCAYGLLAGLFTYTAINVPVWAVVKMSRERIVPDNYHLKEYWTWRPPNQRPWFLRAAAKFCDWTKRRKSRSTAFSLNSGEDIHRAPSVRQHSDTASKGPTDSPPELLRQPF